MKPKIIRQSNVWVTVLGLLTICSTPTALGSVCADAFTRPDVKFTGVDDPSFRSEIIETLPRIEKLLGVQLDISVQLTSNNFYTEAFYDPKPRVVRIGTALRGRSANARLGVFGHEAAHSYTRDRFRFFSGEKWLTEDESLRDLTARTQAVESRPDYQELSLKREELSEKIHRVMNRQDNPAFDKLVADFKDVKAKQDAMMLPIEQSRKTFNRKVKIARAYSELFSDIVAVLVTRNQNVIAEALQEKERKQNPGATAGPRTFEINRFNEWAAEDRFTNPYSILDPARGVLYKLYLENLPESMGPKFAEVFRLASEREVERLHNEGADENLIGRPAPGEINRAFLRAFREIAREHGLPVYRAAGE